MARMNVQGTMHTAAALAHNAAIPVRTVSGNLLDEMQAMAVTMMTEGHGAYRLPTVDERTAMAGIWNTMRSGDLAAADAQARKFGYEVVNYADTSQQKYVALREIPNAEGKTVRGWGTYVYNPSAAAPHLSIQAPHTGDDDFTADIAVRAFRQAQAGALSVAGASRKVLPDKLSDMSHTDQSVFDAIHRQQASRGAVIAQLHGFAQEKHLGYPRVLVSESGRPTTLAPKLSGELNHQGFEANYFDGANFPDLSGRTNVQAASAKAQGAGFLHIESSSNIRYVPDQRATYGGVLGAALGKLGAQVPQ